MKTNKKLQLERLNKLLLVMTGVCDYTNIKVTVYA